ncbi:phage terminase small subunit [Clostridioides difficile]|nr:phage terminase small subunit [Clostridioides difficile]
MVFIAKKRNPASEKAFEIYKEHDGKISVKEISNILGVENKKVSMWKYSHKWDDLLGINKKVGAPKGNQNAKGNRGGKAPVGNQNNRKDGRYSKYFPVEYVELSKDIEDITGLEMLWIQIKTLFINIIASQKKIYVKDNKDHTKKLKKTSKGTKEYEIQFAWDKQLNVLKTLSIAGNSLANLIEKYERLVHQNWDIATDEQKARVSLLKAQTNKITGNDLEIEDIEEIEAEIYGSN